MSELKNIRPIMDTLREVEYGDLLNDCSSLQREILDAVSETGREGKLTITLKYKFEGNGQITITAEDPKAVIPKMPRGKTLFFLTPERNLSRNDPKQIEITGLRSVDDNNDQPVKELNHG